MRVLGCLTWPPRRACNTKAALAALFLFPALVLAQYTPPYIGITGTFSTSNGMPTPNWALTFTPTQVMYVGGTSLVVAGSTCATDVNGHVVGLRNPQNPPILSAVYTGTLPAGNYQAVITWYDSYGHSTLPSPVANLQLTAAGTLNVSPPSSGAPANAIGMFVYIGPLGGSLIYQGQTSTVTNTFQQSTPLTTVGNPPPILNNAVCQVVANDAAWPIAGYNFTVMTASGNSVPGFPQQVQFIGPGSSYDITNGLPLYNGRVTYPVPVLTTPYNHNTQGISGSLDMTQYQIVNIGYLGVGTKLPAWAVDVEGAGTAGDINAINGYLVNGLGGASGLTQCLASVNGAPAAVFVNCSTGTVYYQTVAAAGTAQTQRPTLNFMAPLTVADSASPAETNIGLATIGTGSDAVVANTLAGTGLEPVMTTALGASGHCMAWGATGATDSGGPCALSVAQTDETGSRAFGTQYQNLTGAPIEVQGWGTVHSGSGDSEIACLDGPSSASLTVWSTTTTATVSTEPIGFSCLIPSAYYYEVTVTNIINPLSTAGSWYETTL